MAKLDKIELEKRIFLVQGWIVDGAQTSLILRQILEKGWCTSLRQAERYVAAARKRWIEVEEGTVDEKRRLKVQELKQLKRSLRESYKGTPEGIRAVMAIEKEIIKLEGLNHPKKVELTGKDGAPIAVATVALTKEEIMKISDALEDEF